MKMKAINGLGAKRIVSGIGTVEPIRRKVHFLAPGGKRPKRLRRTKVKNFGYGWTVVICRLKKKKKKKKKISRRLKPVYELAISGLKAHRRFSRGNERGLDSLIKSADKSARKKRNGPFRDSLKNVGKALRVQQKHHSRVLSGTLSRLSEMKAVRRILRP